MILSLHPQCAQHGTLAQMVEQWTENPCVPGSIPGGTTTTRIAIFGFSVFSPFLPDLDQYPLPNFPEPYCKAQTV